jgi:hypothetical protein
MGFVNKSFNDIMTFTRNSTATYVDPTGKIRTAGVNEPRFTFDPETGESLGLLVEEQRTNLFIQSLNFSGWTVAGGASINSSDTIPSNIINPDTGVPYNAVRFTSPTGGVLRRNITLTTANYERTIYVYANTSGQSIRSSEGLLSLPVGKWVRVRRESSSLSSGDVIIIANFSGESVTDAYIIGAQLEQASTPSSYIPTGASAVTRLADNVSRTLGAEFNPNEGSFYIDYQGDSFMPSQTTILIGFGGPTTPTRISLDPHRRRLVLPSGTVTVPLFTLNSGNSGKIVIVFKPESAIFKVYYNGNEFVASAPSFNPASASYDVALCNTGSANPRYPARIKDFRYYPRALSQAEAQSLTKI